MKLKLLLINCLLVIYIFASAQEKPESAEKIMATATRLASKEGKSVMIVFHASWCGWCKKFEASVNDPSCRDFFEKHFIIKYLDILERGDKKSLENPEALDLYKKYGGDGGGIPYFLIFDKSGKLIADSKVKAAGDGPDKPAQNIGCPASEEETAAFIQILSKAAKITDSEKTAIVERFKKNKS